MSTRPSTSVFFQMLEEELAPFPGRLPGAMRDALAIVLAIVIAMTLRIPGFSLSAALLLMMQRERPGLTFRIGFEIFAGAVGAAFMSIMWVQFTDGTEDARFLGITLCIFVSAFCMAASTLPLFFTILGFYGFVDLAYWDTHHSTHAAVSYALNHVASLAIVLACATAVEYVFSSRHPEEELIREMKRRLSVLARFYTSVANGDRTLRPLEYRNAHQALLQVEHGGDFRLHELYDWLRNQGHRSRVPVGLQYRIGVLTRVIHKSVGFGYATHSPQELEDLKRSALMIANVCEDLVDPEKSTHHERVEALPEEHLNEVYQELLQYTTVSAAAGEVTTRQKKKRHTIRSFRLFHPGVFQQSGPVLYALKLTLCALICYILYNAVAWPGILTCVVTVLFTGLSSTGAMKQKQFYRFSGAVIGGVLGILAISVLFPNMDSITSLVVVVYPLAMLAGWVMRSPRIGYVGVQIGFAFFLTTLQGFGAATQFTAARDRVIGITLGILVMWFVFDQLWPTRTSDVLAATLQKVQTATHRLQEMMRHEGAETSAFEFQRLRNQVSLELTSMQQMASAVQFELGRHRRREIALTRKLVAQIETEAARFYAEAGRYAV
ncbi:FUSC family protein [Terriglobus tenax]|uniref:FUSC family protein n=1 Tax=Terriglobus tenax TaxID=1111115 RepID=UPI0021E00C15|nr:FUSC family protein [Terriglobus tenax]